MLHAHFVNFASIRLSSLVNEYHFLLAALFRSYGKMLALGDQGGCLAYAIAIVSSLCVEELFYSLDTDAVKDKKEEEAARAAEEEEQEAAKKKKEADGEDEPAAAKSERESKEEKRRRDEVCQCVCCYLCKILIEFSTHCLVRFSCLVSLQFFPCSCTMTKHPL
jgi:HrpA-like RNA helicase